MFVCEGHQHVILPHVTSFRTRHVGRGNSHFSGDAWYIFETPRLLEEYEIYGILGTNYDIGRTDNWFLDIC
jgi:hypothetical protein